MIRITRSADCGNSPKNAAVEEIAIMLEGGEWSGHAFGESTVWALADGSLVEGPDGIRETRRIAPKEIRIDHAIAHGKVGAVSGVTDGEAFAYILTYTSASMKRLARIDSYRKTGKTNG